MEVQLGEDKVALIFGSINGMTEDADAENKCGVALAVDGENKKKSKRLCGETANFGLTTFDFATGEAPVEASVQYKTDKLVP